MEATDFKGMSLVEKLKEIEKVLDEEIRPMLAADGGSLEVVDIKDSDGYTDIYINYLGACRGCAASTTGTLYAIQNYLNQRVDDSIRVFPVG
ncbi:MAG: NifU family protein [Brevinematia bacterium]